MIHHKEGFFKHTDFSWHFRGQEGCPPPSHLLSLSPYINHSIPIRPKHRFSLFRFLSLPSQSLRSYHF